MAGAPAATVASTQMADVPWPNGSSRWKGQRQGVVWMSEPQMPIRHVAYGARTRNLRSHNLQVTPPHTIPTDP